MPANMPQELEIDSPSHSQLLQDAGMYVFMDDVNNESMKPIIEWILVENHVTKKKKKELLLMICSEGGDMGAAFALIDVMKSSRLPIKTVGLGTIASAGLMIFIAGHAQRRVLTPNTSILSHQWSWYSAGKDHELLARVKEFELTSQRMLNLYKNCTGLSESKIKEVLLHATVYCGIPAGLDAFKAANEVLKEMGKVE